MDDPPVLPLAILSINLIKCTGSVNGQPAMRGRIPVKASGLDHPLALLSCIVTTQIEGLKPLPSALPLVQKLSKHHDLVLKAFHLLENLCNQPSGGHSGDVSCTAW